MEKWEIKDDAMEDIDNGWVVWVIITSVIALATVGVLVVLLIIRKNRLKV